MFTLWRTIMSSRTDVMDLHQGEPAWQSAGDDEGPEWESSLSEVSRPKRRQNQSLARRLECSRTLAGAVAAWLFVKGGMVVVLFPALFMLALIGAILGLR
jgi:hypothetical protein